MKAALEGIGFHVTLLTDGTGEQMDRAISTFTKNIPKEAIALIYFAGHGVELGGANYLIPVDLDARDKAQLTHRAVNVSEMLQEMDESPARVRLLILDACRNNPYRSLRDLAGVGLGKQDAMGSLIAFSTSPGRVALDGAAAGAEIGAAARDGSTSPGGVAPKGGHSVYTAELVKELTARTPGEMLEQVFKRVAERVAKLTNKEQIPYLDSGLTGDWYPFGLPQRKEPSSIQIEVAEREVRDAERILANGDFSGALQHLDTALDLNWKDIPAYIYRAAIRGLTGDSVREADDLSEAIRLAPDDYRGYLARGLARKNAGNCLEAIKDFDTAAKLEPAHAVTYRYRAECNAEIGSYDAAEADFQTLELLAKGRP